ASLLAALDGLDERLGRATFCRAGFAGRGTASVRWTERHTLASASTRDGVSGRSLPPDRLLEARGARLRAGGVALSPDARLQRRHAVRCRGMVAAEAAGVEVVVLQVVHQAARGVARLAEEDHGGAVRLGLLPAAVALGHGGDDDVLHRVA